VGDIVDPAVDRRLFTREPADLGRERYAHTTLLMRSEGYLPGCLAVGAALRWQVQSRAALICLIDASVPPRAREMLEHVYDDVPVVPRLAAHESAFPKRHLRLERNYGSMEQTPQGFPSQSALVSQSVSDKRGTLHARMSAQNAGA
jgi:hypothetical protein